jgi:hypothetical protein
MTLIHSWIRKLEGKLDNRFILKNQNFKKCTWWKIKHDTFGSAYLQNEEGEIRQWSTGIKL